MFLKQHEVVSNNVHILRKSHKLTQEELGRLVGVTRQTIIAIEKGNYVPSVLLAIKLAQILGRKVEEIFSI